MAENLYREVKNSLEGNKDIVVAGPVWNFDSDYRNPETAHFFVAPIHPIEFDDRELDRFGKSLEPHSSFVFASGWREIQLESGGSTRSLVFGALTYQDKLKEVRDMENLVGYVNALQPRGEAPHINKFHSDRVTFVNTYPNADYASQVFVYQSKLARTGKSDPKMDWLSHDITREQLDALLAVEGRVRFAMLSDLPSEPKLYTHYTGH